MEKVIAIVDMLTEGNRLILLGLWICGHCLIVVTFITRARNIAFVSMAVILLTLYCLKPPTYDLEKYSVFFDTGYLSCDGCVYKVADEGVTLRAEDITGLPYDFGEKAFSNMGFSYLIRLMSQSLPSGMYLPRLGLPGYESWFVADSMALGIIALSFILLQFSVTNLLRETTSFYLLSGRVLLITAPIIIGSIFFLLGSQNSIRQFLAATITILALSCYVRQRYFWALIFLLVANTFHHWGWVFGLGLAMFLFGYKVVGKLNFRIKKINLLRIEYFALIAGFITTLILVFIVRVPVLTGYLSETTNPLILWFLDHGYGEIMIYTARLDFSGYVERFSVEYKIALIGLLLLISELLAGRTTDSLRIPIRSLRRSMFLFLAPISLFPEIASRLLFFYFCIEMVWLVSMIYGESLRPRVAAAFVFASYTVAPNAINMIIGGSWRYSLG